MTFLDPLNAAGDTELRRWAGSSCCRRAHAFETACPGGRGRTGTALAALAVLDGMPANRAVRWMRHAYDAKAVETPWQDWWVHTVPRPRRP